jgi:hypothetical protein
MLLKLFSKYVLHIILYFKNFLLQNLLLKLLFGIKYHDIIDIIDIYDQL